MTPIESKSTIVNRYQSGLIQIPILIAIVIGILVVVGGGYVGVREYVKNQERTEKEIQVVQENAAQEIIEPQVMPEIALVVQEKVSTSTNDMAAIPYKEAETLPKEKVITSKPEAAGAQITSISLSPVSIVSTKTVAPVSVITPVPTPTPQVIQPPALVAPILAPVPSLVPLLPPASEPTPQAQTIPDLQVTDIVVSSNDVSANISFKTSIPATSKIFYWIGNQGGLVASSPSGSQTSHLISLSSLVQQTSYNYRIEVVSDAGITKSHSGMFTTSKTPGLLTASLDRNTSQFPQLVVGNSMPRVAAFRFTAQNDTYTVKELTLTTNGDSAVTEYVFKLNGSEIARQSPVNGNISVAGLSVSVPAGSFIVIDVLAKIAEITAENSGTDVAVVLTGVEHQNSSGSVTTSETSLPGKSNYAHRTKPLITRSPGTPSALNWNSTAIKFSVTGQGNPIFWKSITFNFTKSANIILEHAVLHDAVSGAGQADCVISIGNSTIRCPNMNPSQSYTSREYSLVVGISGDVAIGDSISTWIDNSGLGYESQESADAVTTSATFVWSDGTGKWHNDYLMSNIPLDHSTLSCSKIPCI